MASKHADMDTAPSDAGNGRNSVGQRVNLWFGKLNVTPWITWT